MDIPLKIKVDDKDNNVCDQNCPFLSTNFCSLFSTYLKLSCIWSDEDKTTMDRCTYCLKQI